MKNMFAFSQDQFNDGMGRLGLEPNDIHQITSIGAGASFARLMFRYSRKLWKL